jgi:Flp pilus assembly protein CpaB
MRSAISARRGPSIWTFFFMMLLTLVIGAAATLGTLHALEIVDLRQLFVKPLAATEPPPPKGTPIPMSVRSIPAYTTITREHLINPQTNSFNVAHLELKTHQVVQDGIITSNDANDRLNGTVVGLDRLLGRVLMKEKAAGYAFKDSDFFPEGTRPGLVAGIPPGKRAVALDVTKVQGVVYLNAGDHFDLLASWPVDLERALTGGRGGSVSSPNPALHAEIHNRPKRAGVNTIVHNGLVVQKAQPVKTPPRRSIGRPLPEQEIIIAVEPEEIAALTEALTTDAEITCVARSGQLGDPGAASVTPGSNPIPKVTTVDTFTGSKRHTVAFPAGGSGTPESPAHAPGNQPSKVPPGGGQPGAPTPKE